MAGGGQSNPGTGDFVTFERLIHLQLSDNQSTDLHPTPCELLGSCFLFICRTGPDAATVMENSTLGCKSVTQDVMAEVISPGPNFSGNWVLTHRGTDTEHWWQSCRAQLSTILPSSQSQFVSQGNTKNDPESNSKESEQRLDRQKKCCLWTTHSEKWNFVKIDWMHICTIVSMPGQLKTRIHGNCSHDNPDWPTKTGSPNRRRFARQHHRTSWDQSKAIKVIKTRQEMPRLHQQHQQQQHEEAESDPEATINMLDSCWVQPGNTGRPSVTFPIKDWHFNQGPSYPTPPSRSLKHNSTSTSQAKSMYEFSRYRILHASAQWSTQHQA